MQAITWKDALQGQLPDILTHEIDIMALGFYIVQHLRDLKVRAAYEVMLNW